MEAQSQHTRTDRLSPLQQLRAYKATSLSYQILMMAIFFDQKQKLEKTSPQYPHQRSAVTHTLNAPPATAGICLKLKLAALKTLYSKHSMFPNGHHRTRHGSVLRMPTKIKHNGQSQTKKELLFFFFTSHKGLIRPRGTVWTALLLQKHQQTGSRKRLINQKYFIKWSSIHISDRATLSQRSFVFFETMRLKRLIVFRQCFCARLTPLLSEDVDANLSTGSSRCVRSEKDQYVF